MSGIFNSVNPASQQRLDLVIYDPGKPTHLYDMVVSNPVSQAVLDSNKVNVRQTEVMQLRKEGTYREKATAAGMLLHGAALECYG